MGIISLDINGSTINGVLTNFTQTRYAISLLFDPDYEIVNGTTLYLEFTSNVLSANHGLLNTTKFHLSLNPFVPETQNLIRLASKSLSSTITTSATYAITSISMINPTPASL